MHNLTFAVRSTLLKDDQGTILRKATDGQETCDETACPRIWRLPAPVHRGPGVGVEGALPFLLSGQLSAANDGKGTADKPGSVYPNLMSDAMCKRCQNRVKFPID